MLTDTARHQLPAIAHVDGTARLQTVSAAGEPWLYALLKRVGLLTGHAVLANTSFNSRGRPILNSIGEALELLAAADDLDAVMVDDFWFQQ